MVVYRLDDRLFFANTNYVTARILEAIEAAPDDTRWLVFDAECVADACPIAHEASGRGELARLIDARQFVTQCQCGKLVDAAIEECVGPNNETTCLDAFERGKCVLEFTIITRRERM